MPALYGKNGTISFVGSTVSDIREIKCTYNAIVRKIRHIQSTASPATYCVASRYLRMLGERCKALSDQYYSASFGNHSPSDTSSEADSKEE